MKIRVMQIWGFLLAILGWIFVACSMAMEGWKISSIGGQGGKRYHKGGLVLVQSVEGLLHGLLFYIQLLRLPRAGGLWKVWTLLKALNVHEPIFLFAK